MCWIGYQSALVLKSRLAHTILKGSQGIKVKTSKGLGVAGVYGFQVPCRRPMMANDTTATRGRAQVFDIVAGSDCLLKLFLPNDPMLTRPLVC